MPAHIILGAQWGEEAKAKVVNLFCESAAALVLAAPLHPLAPDAPSPGLDLLGLPPSLPLVFGAAMPLDLHALIHLLGSRQGKVVVDPRAPVILPHHVLLDRLRHAAAPLAFGGMRHGAQACLVDRQLGRSVLVKDLFDPPRLEQLIGQMWGETAVLLEHHGERPSREHVISELAALSGAMASCVSDTQQMVGQWLGRRKTVVFSSDQGVGLDEMTGHYPYTNGHHHTALGIALATGLPWRGEALRVTGVAKAYCTRQGPGPLPTQVEDPSLQNHWRHGGQEEEERKEAAPGTPDAPGTRFGWIDAAALKHAIKLGGLTELALTKLDALSGLETLKINVGYRTPQGTRQAVPCADAELLAGWTPLYEEMPGWAGGLSQVREWAEMPQEAKHFLRRLEMLVECPLSLVSVGDRRSETVILRQGTSQAYA